MYSIIRDKLLKPNGESIPYIWNVREKHDMVLLCLHGFAGDKDSSVIAALTECLDEKGIGVVTFDWPAHGESDSADESLTVDSCLLDLDTMLGWLNQKVNKPVACFATSFGGYLATLYRNDNPQAFVCLILRSPALKMSKIFRKMITDYEFDELLQGKTIVQGFERKMNIGMEFYESLCSHEPFPQAPPAPENVFIIQGDKDDVVDPEDTMLYAKLNGIDIKIFEGTDHRYKNAGDMKSIVAETEQFLFKHLVREKENDLY